MTFGWEIELDRSRIDQLRRQFDRPRVKPRATRQEAVEYAGKGFTFQDAGVPPFTDGRSVYANVQSSFRLLRANTQTVRGREVARRTSPSSIFIGYAVDATQPLSTSASARRRVFD